MCGNHSKHAQELADQDCEKELDKEYVDDNTMGGEGTILGPKGGGDDIGETVTFNEAIAAARAERARVGRTESETDTEPDADAEPAGAGLRGRGPPLQVGHGTKLRTVCDGAGLCSL